MHKYFLTFIDYNVRYYWRLERSTDGGLVIRQCVVPHSAGGLTCSDVAYGLAPVPEDARGRREGGGGDVDMIDFISAFPYEHDLNFSL